MSGVRRKKENIDVLEHAMMGVRTSENDSLIVSFDSTPGVIGTRSEVVVDLRGIEPEQREVVVRMPKVGSRRRTR